MLKTGQIFFRNSEKAGDCFAVDNLSDGSFEGCVIMILAGGKVDKRINDIFDYQEMEDRLELQTNYCNLIRREFKDSGEILSKNPSGARFHMDRHLLVSRVPVRIATEFSIRKHTTILTPYYHRHEFYELMYVYEGIGRQYINDDEREAILHKGEACLIPPGTIHAVMPIGQEDIILKMVIPTEMFQELWNHEFEAKGNEVRFFPVPMNSDGSVRWLLTKLLEELYFDDGHRDSYKQISVKSYLTLLFVALTRNRTDFLENGLLYQVSRQIGYDLKHVQLREVAENMGYSPRHLERLLREKAGCTFSDVLQKLRMDTAAQLLTETDDTLEQIAEKTGYQTQAGLYKRFCAVFGMTPGRYRRLHRDE